MSAGPFRGRTAAWLVGVSAVSFVFALLLAVFGDEFARVPSARADTTSRSAIGHKAFVEVLKSVGIPVLVSRFDATRRDGTSALLVVAEPDLGDGDEARRASFEGMLKRKGVVLLVLPKWQGWTDPSNKAWIQSAELISLARVREVLKPLVDGPAVFRARAGDTRSWDKGDLPVAPTIDEPQLIGAAPGIIVPIVTMGEGTLVGMVERGGSRTYVLSDPDVLSTHGLGQGDNAWFATSLVDLARDNREAVVFDETLHGIQAVQSLWQELFRFPLVIVLIQALLAVGVLLWAAMGRFGAPVPEAPALAAGKRFLVDNTADLMQFGGHATGALDRYFKTTVQDVARAVHAPPGLPKSELTEWLRRAGRTRGTAVDVEDLENAVAAARGDRAHDVRLVVAAAAGIHRWRREMIDGSSGDS